MLTKNQIIKDGEMTPFAKYLAENYPDRVHEVTIRLKDGTELKPLKIKLKKSHKSKLK